MAQTGYTPILIYSSSTVSQAPSAGNLTNSTLGSELAINITDGKLFYKDNGGSVQVIGWKTVPTTAGGTGLTSYTAGDLLYYATGTTLSKLTIGASKTILTSSGTAPQWSTNLDTTQGGTGLTSYAAGDLTYYASGTTLTKLPIGANTTILTSSGTAPQWSAASSVSIGTATNLASGVAGSVPYQSGAGATTFLGIGAANTVLTSSGTAPQWSTALTLSGNVTSAALIPSSSTIPTNGLFLPGSNIVGVATNSTEAFRVNSAQNTIFGGSTASGTVTVFAASANTSISYRSGAGELARTVGQTATSVSTSATAILPVTLGYGGWAIVNGYSSSNSFADFVFIGYTTAAVLSSQTITGSPVARTYTVTTGQLKLAMASGTYTVTAFQESINAY